MQLVEYRIGEPVEDALARLYAEGKQQKEIAEILDIERSTVSRWMKDFRIGSAYDPDGIEGPGHGIGA